MKKIFSLVMALMLSVIGVYAGSIDWSQYSWLGDGAGGGAYNNKYKCSTVTGMNVVNIQQPGWGTAAGIYIEFPAGISACTVSNDIQGAGVLLHLSAFTAKETDVTVTAGGNEYKFVVYFVDGTEAIDWSQYDWIGDGAGGGAYSNKYKCSTVSGMKVINIQQPAWGTKAGIYIEFPAGISSCSVSNNIQGAGVLLHLTAFTAKETSVTVVAGGTTYKFVVYYADGTSGAASISVDPESKIFKAYDETATVAVTASNLTEDITITCPTGFESSVSTISKSAEFPYNVTITCKTSSPSEFANVTFTSGTASATTKVRFRVPETIVFTGGSIENSGVHLIFNGYGSTYTSSQAEISKYKGSAKIGSSSSKLRIDAAQGDNLYCVLDWVPVASDVTVVTLEYENGDCGKATFTGTTFTSTAACGAVITVDPTSLNFTAKDQQQTFDVAGEDLSADITITSNDPTNFTVSPSSITMAKASDQITVTYVGTSASASSTITVSSGSVSKTVNVNAELQPTLTVDKSSLTFTEVAGQTISVGASSLIGDVSLAITGDGASYFTVSKSSIGQSEAFPQDATVNYLGGANATATLTISSQNATSKTVTLTGYNNTECSGFSSQAYQESFDVGYNYSFVTSENNITCAFTLLGSKTVDNAELWNNTSGFTTKSATVVGNTATVTLENVTTSTITVACKFVFVGGGMAVTKYFTYTKGHTCQPTIFTDKESMTFDAPNVEQALVVTSEALTADITATITEGSFSLDKSSVSSTGGTFNVTYTGSESTDSGSLTLSSTGATNKVIPLSVVLPVPEITVSTSAMTFVSTSTISAAAQTFTVSGENLKSALTISCSNTEAFDVTPATAPQSGAATEVTVTFKGSENATGTITISGTEAEDKTVTLKGYYNTACNGYLVATAGDNTLPLTYSVAETPAGQFVIQYKFSRSVVGIAPQIYFEDTSIFRDMTYQGDNTYSLTTDNEAVTAATFKYKAYCPSTSEGTYQTETTTYTKGSCDVQLVKAGNKSYTSLAAALADYTLGSTLVICGDLGDVTTSIDKHVLINASGFNIGNITVGTSGKLEFVTNAAAMKTFVVQNIPGTGAGQVVTNGNTITAEAAYLEREIYSGDHEELWYSFGVPFNVDARNGVYSTAGNKVNYGQYYIQKYDGAKRAEYGILKYGQTGYAWSEVSTLEKGTGYMIYLMASCPKTLRFKASDASDLFLNNEPIAVTVTQYTGSAATTNHGWNFMAQPRMQNANLAPVGGSTFSWGGEVLVQVLLEGGSDAEDYQGDGYTTKETDGLIMAPFTTYMFQAGGKGALNFIYNASDDPTLKSAEDVEYNYFIVALSNEAGKSDNFFASASEDALEDEYQLGRDLIKCGSSDSRLQICSEAFGQILTANDVKAYDGVGDMSLRLSIPKAGNYSIQVTRPASSGEIFLTKDGDVIADLTDGEAYEFASAKGVNKQYGLRIVLDEEITTDASEADAEVSVYANDGIIYVNGVKAADVMNLLGQRVANPVAEGGIYLVNAGGKYVKINVE